MSLWIKVNQNKHLTRNVVYLSEWSSLTDIKVLWLIILSMIYMNGLFNTLNNCKNKGMIVLIKLTNTHINIW